MKGLYTLICVTVLMLAVQAVWIEDEQCRDRYQKRRGYKAGFLDPEMMLASGKAFTAHDARRGSIEKMEDLPEIEWYENTRWTAEKRDKFERKMYKTEDLMAWDQVFSNVTELSREMYDFYIIDPDNGKYIMPNQSYVILFGIKDDLHTLWWGDRISKASCELNAHEFTPLFVDTQLDPALGATFDRKQNP